MKKGITLITMGSGNVKVLRKTLESFSGICDEIIYGDLLLFPEDREVVTSYQKDFNLKILALPFDYIFSRGFSACLNLLALHSSNDMVMYMNTSEVIDEDYGTLDVVKNNPDCNTFFFTHRTDPHRWFRLYNKQDLCWSGLIHEQLRGEYRPYHKPVFMMKDLEKDMDDPFKAKVFDTLKEAVYFQNYINMLNDPLKRGETDPGWVRHVEDNNESFKDRLDQKGDGYRALLHGDYEMFMKYIYTNPDFENQRFESNIAIEYQQDKKYLL